jgi:hypothetical protein
MDSQCTPLTSALEPALGREKAMNEAVAWLRGVCGDLTALEPAVEIIFAMAGLPTTLTADIPSLRDLTSGYIRDQHQRGGDAPNDLGARLALEGLKLPPEIQAKSHTDFAGLFAPVLLATSAREKLYLNRELALIARGRSRNPILRLGRLASSRQILQLNVDDTVQIPNEVNGGAPRR